MYKGIIRRFLFLLSPENAHHFSVFLLKCVLAFPGMKALFTKLFCVSDARLGFEKKGIHFPNRVGLAAGFDKNASFFKEFRYLGFGSIEVGTITPLPQPGNALPRLFRLTEDEALINRMGFNNDGVGKLVERLKSRPTNLVIGGNIGKNKDTPLENAISDYLICFRSLYHNVDYIAVNVSSPNTQGLRTLQEREPLKNLLLSLKSEAKTLNTRIPILLKISPDLSQEAINDVIQIIKETGIDGAIAANTTISRDGLVTDIHELHKIGAGGLSGKTLRARSTEMVKQLRQELGNEALIIGVGGISSAQDAIEKIEAGADLIQVYTGLIYEGPGLIKSINKRLLAR
jgi:dihydroorotate dehydrogenase